MNHIKTDDTISPCNHPFLLYNINSLYPRKNLKFSNIFPIEISPLGNDKDPNILIFTKKYYSEVRQVSRLEIEKQLEVALNTIHQNIISLIDGDVYLKTLDLEKILIEINTENINLKKNIYDIECEYEFRESIERVLNILQRESKYGLDTIYRAVDILLSKHDYKNLVNIVLSLYRQLPTKIINISLEQIKSSSEHIIQIIVFNELSKIIKEFKGEKDIINTQLLDIHVEAVFSRTTQYIEEKDEHRQPPKTILDSSAWQKGGELLFQTDAKHSNSRANSRVQG